jgi:RNA polymerase sigma-70 factor, ECF subfamily
VGDDDRTLVAAAKEGDRAALEQLLRRHQDRVHRLCRRLTGNDADALDATQEALVAMVRGLPRFDGRSSFATWAYRVATNACLDELRRRSRRRVVPLTADLAAGLDDPPGDQVGLEDAATTRIDVDRALEALSPEHRAAIVLRDVCGLDYAEIADGLAIPIGTVRSRIARARAAVSRHLTGNPPTSSHRPTC